MLALLWARPIARPDSLTMAHWLLVWGVAVVTPLSLELGGAPPVLRRLHPAVALGMGLGWLWEGSWLRAGSLLWLLYTALLAGWGARRWVSRADFCAAESTLDLGLLYSLVGGTWCFAFGWRGGLMGFDRTLTLLTATHFCYVTLGAMPWAACAARAGTAPMALLRLYWVSPALVAAGITLSHIRGHATWLEALAVSAQVAATAGISLLSLRHHGLITLSALCSLLTMLLALNYAWGRLLQAPHLDLAWMIPYHGLLNAVGFVSLGLLGWCINEFSGPAPKVDG